ncbi:MAG: PocR ligand-binding domain-containing protein [Bacteroidales bacterium]
MKINILELIDFEKVNNLLEGFNKSTGFVTAILDLNGNVLSKSGWRQICTEFHRINPETAKKCTISDTELANKMSEGEKYHFYNCLNGLVDVAVPIIIKGEHIANLFSGQFFFEEPDKSFFIKQAKEFGFDEKKYMDALEKVPVVSEGKVKVAMDFLVDMTKLISEISFQKLEQVELNKTLKESDFQYRSLANAGLALIWTSGTDKLCNYFNDPWLKFTGRTLEQEMGNGWTEGVHPDDFDKCLETYITAFDKREPFEMEYRLRHVSGEYRIILDMGTPNFNSNGEFIGYIGHCIDITDRKKSEHALVHFHELMRYVIEHNQSAVAIHDKDLKYIYVSQRYLNDYKVKEKNIIGKHHYEVFPDLPQKWRDVHQKALSGEISRADNDSYLREDGTLEWTRWECRPWYEADGSIGGIIIYTEVITERKRVEQELTVLKNELQVKVNEQTKELKEKVDELERMNKAFIGREMRIKELRDKLKESGIKDAES